MKQLRFLRKKMKLSQEELASLVGVSASLVSKWELTELNPSAEMRNKLSDVLKCHPDDFGIEDDEKNIIRKLRKEKGYTQAQFAKLCGLSGTTVHNVESSKFDVPEYKTLVKMAEVLGCEPEHLGTFRNDLTNQRFGDLLVIKCVGMDDRHHLLWQCECKCNNKTVKSSDYLNRTPYGMCEVCHQNSLSEDLKGRTFGKLKVQYKTEKRYGSDTNSGRGGSVIWYCLCECGNTIEMSSEQLMHGKEPSCKKCREKKLVDQVSDMRKKSVICDTTPGKLKDPSKKNSRNKSSRRGVYWNKKSETWGASISIMQKHYSLGLYDDFDKAVAVREKAEILLFGGFLEWHSSQKGIAGLKKSDFYLSPQFRTFLEWRETFIHVMRKEDKQLLTLGQRSHNNY